LPLIQKLRAHLPINILFSLAPANCGLVRPVLSDQRLQDCPPQEPEVPLVEEEEKLSQASSFSPLVVKHKF
jgi:hypothetical protein